MTRLPVPGGDAHTWGGVLNDFLMKQHNSDGTHNVPSMLQVPASSGQMLVTNTALASGVQWRVATKGDVGLSNVTNDAQVKVSDVDTDELLAANSNSRIPTQRAAKAYADARAMEALALAVAL